MGVAKIYSTFYTEQCPEIYLCCSLILWSDVADTDAPITIKTLYQH